MGPEYMNQAASKLSNPKTSKDLWWDESSLTATTESGRRTRKDERFERWRAGSIKLDLLEQSLISQAILVSELKAKDVQLKEAEKTIEKLSREVGRLAVAHDAAVDNFERSRAVLECIFSGRFQEELEAYIQLARTEMIDSQVDVPSSSTLKKFASVAKGFSKSVLLRYIMNALGPTTMDYDG